MRSRTPVGACPIPVRQIKFNFLWLVSCYNRFTFAVNISTYPLPRLIIMWGPRFGRARGVFGRTASERNFLSFIYGVSWELGQDKFQGIYSKSSYIQNLVKSYDNDRLLARVAIIEKFLPTPTTKYENHKNKKI